MKRLAFILCLTLSLAASAKVVLVLRSPESPAAEAPELEHPEVVWVANSAALDFTPTVTNEETVTSWSEEGFAEWVSINSSTGQLTGTATTGKTYGKITATNAQGSFSIYLTIHSYSSEVTVDSDYISNNTEAWGGLLFDTPGCKYTFATDLTCDGTAIAVRGANIGVDLNGYDVIFDNLADTGLAITNSDLETGDATGWTLDSGVTVVASDYLEGECAEEGDGYAIRFVVPNGQTLTASTSGNVTLSEGTDYIYAGMTRFSSGTGVTVNFNVTGSGHELEVRSSRNGCVDVYDNNRFTASTDVTAPLVISVENTSGAERTVWVDLPGIHRLRRHGLYLKGGTASAWCSDVEHTGSDADGFTLDGGGGSITQGNADSPDSCPVFARGVEELTLQDTTLEHSGYAGLVGYTVHAINAKGMHCQNMTINNNVRYIADRDARYGTALRCGEDELYVINNTITAGGYIGILCQPDNDGNVDVAYNTVYPKSRYTNGFGITWNGVPGATLTEDYRLHHNVVNSAITSDHTNRGIHFDNARSSEVYNNTVTVQELALNQEYKGPVDNGAYGMQFENEVIDMHVHDNVTTSYNVAGAGNCTLALKMEVGSEGNIFEDNEWIVDTDGTEIPAGGSTTHPANCIWVDGRVDALVTGGAVNSANNTFTDAGASFVTDDLTPGVHVLRILSTGTGGHAVVDVYGIASVDSETQLTLTSQPHDGTSDTDVDYSICVDYAAFCTIRDETFRSKERFGMFKRTTGMNFNGCTWDVLSGGSGSYAYWAEEGGGTGELTVDLKFIDQVYSDASARSAFESFAIPAIGATAGSTNDDASDSGNDNVELAWTITIHVTDGGVDQEGLSVEVLDANTSTVVASGTTDANGNVTVILDEYRYASGSMGSARAYDIDVETVEEQADYTPTQAETVEIAL